MLKKEILWRELLYQTIEKHNLHTTQQALALQFGYSLSTVFHALKIPRAIGAVEAGRKGVRMRDYKKLITLWATVRKLNKDIIYKTTVQLTQIEIEKHMPSAVIWGAYSAVRLKSTNHPMPASYDKVYVYAEKDVLKNIRKRFPPQKGEPNLIILAPDPKLSSYGKFTTAAQTLADLWNLPEWYAHEFYQALIEEI